MAVELCRQIRQMPHIWCQITDIWFLKHLFFNFLNQFKPYQKWLYPFNWLQFLISCFIQKIYALSSSLLQGKHLPFSPSPLCLNIFRLFVIFSLTQLYRYTPDFIICIGTIICILKAYFTFERRWSCGIVTHGRSREFRMHMKNPAQTGSGCIRFNDWKVDEVTFAEYSCPIRLRGAR
jgi:hypothetical protein